MLLFLYHRIIKQKHLLLSEHYMCIHMLSNGLFDSGNGDHLPDVLVLLDQELQLWASQGKRCNKKN